MALQQYYDYYQNDHWCTPIILLSLCWPRGYWRKVMFAILSLQPSPFWETALKLCKTRNLLIRCMEDMLIYVFSWKKDSIFNYIKRYHGNKKVIMYGGIGLIISFTSLSKTGRIFFLRNSKSCLDLFIQ